MEIAVGQRAGILSLALCTTLLEERTEPSVRIIGKQHDEFEQFFLANYDSITRSVSYVCGDHEVAADATQEAFVRAYRRWNRVNGYDNPAAYVRRIAINLTRDEHRSRQRRARRESLGHRPATVNDPADDVIAGGAIDSLASLPERQRAIAALFYLDDLSTAEISQLLDIAEGTVRFHLAQARDRLRADLTSRPAAESGGTDVR